ncbi:hypothetical protein C3F09_11475 [candidate division GN15 bacterium]|uniref:Outer membrane protein beta-barrel domain-containing protein n=1 Tax=candidate division GN15 bacterium TaxID=2072418 RepID=A0A855WYI4_9BACT|nr:MAG: hypothetical protein C3F09_11475 [candidate division GN15 bacterium]
MWRRTVVLLTLLLAAAALSAQTPKIGLGGFGGLSIPVVQDDQASGTEFGIRARVKLPIVTVEPNVSFAKWGKADPPEGITDMPDGSKVTSFGIDALLGGAPGVPGFKPFFVIGGASYKVKNDDTGYDESKLGFSAGLGVMLGLAAKLDLDVRGKAVVIPTDGGGSKKAVSVTAGVAVNL